jgi:transglutaminase-like putative cysteine protease
MGPELSRLVRRATFALAALASAATEVAAADDRPVPTSLGLAAVWIAVAALLGRLVPPPADGRRNPPRFVTVVLLLLAAAPFAVEPLRRDWAGEGYPLELQLVFALRNLALGLAAFAAWRLCLRLACAASLFLMLFAVSMTDHPAVQTLLGLYSAGGSVWLMLVYWSDLRHFFVASDRAVALEVQPGREHLPWFAVFVVVALTGSALGLLAVGPARAARVLAELLPTSGGTGDYDPHARGGVNDGDDEVAGENARSTGMTPSDTFLDSPLPSLYDNFNDLYGEPFKPRDPDQAVALDGRTGTRESKKPPADNLRPNREFATTRKGPRRPRDPSDRAARAIFEVRGRTPLHVRVTAFDAFDGVAWREAPFDGNPFPLEKEPNSCWMGVWEPKTPAVLVRPEPHQFKVTRPSGALVPTPPHLLRFRIGRVNRADFFAWGQEGILRMTRRKTPEGTVVETESRTVDPRQLGGLHFIACPPGEQAPYLALPRGRSREVAELVRRWTAGQPWGWTQVAAVLQRLRADYTLDPAARVPDDCTDPLGHFLLHARRGPDYQFATAAAVLLRILGYQTRLMSGFYVAPDHYDPATRHTPVVPEDLHFWAEVKLPSGDWLVAEATPGYEVLRPEVSLSERLASALLAAAAWGQENAAGLALGLVFLGGLWWRRRELADAAGVLLWRCFPGRTWRQCVRRALRLLEWRGRCAGQPRRASQTIPAWLRSALNKETSPEKVGVAGAESSKPRGALPGLRRLSSGHAGRDSINGAKEETGIARLTSMAEWAAYAQDLEPPWGDDEVRGVCRRVLGDWTLRRWRAAAASRSGGRW